MSISRRIEEHLAASSGLRLDSWQRRMLDRLYSHDRCYSLQPTEMQHQIGFMCTLPGGHEGPHAATLNGRLLAVWPRAGTHSVDVVDAVLYCGATNGLRGCCLPDGHEGPHEWPASCGRVAAPGVACELGAGHGGRHKVRQAAGELWTW